MKLFVTLGFERHSFDRLLKAIDIGIGRGIFPEDTLIQRGYSRYSPSRGKSVTFLAYDQMESALGAADIVIAHAGVGTLLHCLHMQKIPILFPRSACRGEHVDDHQVVFAQVMEEKKRALVAYDTPQLFHVFQSYPRLVQKIAAASSGNGGARLRGYLAHRLSTINEELRMK